MVEKVFRCDIKVKLVLSVLCLELLFNAFAFLLESKKLPQKAFSKEATNSYLYCLQKYKKEKENLRNFARAYLKKRTSR